MYTYIMDSSTDLAVDTIVTEMQACQNVTKLICQSWEVL